MLCPHSHQSHVSPRIPPYPPPASFQPSLPSFRLLSTLPALLPPPCAADMLSPYQFYQFLFKTVDADVIRFMRMLTFMPLEEIDAVEAAMQVRAG